MLTTHYVPVAYLHLAACDLREGRRAYVIAATPADQLDWSKFIRRHDLGSLVVYKIARVSA